MKETHFVITGWLILSIVLFITWRVKMPENLALDLVCSILGGGNICWLVLILKVVGVNNRFLKPNRENNE